MKDFEIIRADPNAMRDFQIGGIVSFAQQIQSQVYAFDARAYSDRAERRRWWMFWEHRKSTLVALSNAYLCLSIGDTAGAQKFAKKIF